MKHALSVLWVYLKPYRKWVIIGPLLMAMEVVMDLLQPRLLATLIDVGIANLDSAVVYRTGALMVGIACIGLLGGGGNTVIVVRLAQAFGADLREALFAKVQALSFGNLDRLGTGELITRLTNDVTQVQEAVMMALRILVRTPLLLLGSVILAVFTSPSLSLLLLALGPVVLGIIFFVVRRAFPMFGAVQAALDNLNTVMQENLAGVRVVKAFAREEREIARFGGANDALLTKTIAAIRLLVIAGPSMILAVNLGMVGALWFGGIQVNQGTLLLGQLVAFINYLQTALRETMMVSMLVMQLSRALASAERIVHVLETHPEIVDRPPKATSALAPATGQVRFDHVTFGYDGAHADAVLSDVSFTAEPGQTVAILGATGAGKTSLVHLIPRFYDVTDGRVLLDGVDVRAVPQSALRRQIGMALQETVLFSGTVRDNIRYGRPDASEEEVIDAAQRAQAHGFIMELPEGYDAIVGQRGVNLSGGQKQRIAIARAILTQPAVLILDDSTSAVDVETEALIQEALAVLMRGRTSFVIAQRISTVLNADKILVLDQGALVAEGTHDTLLQTSPVYREIYDSQLGNGARAYA